MYLMNNIYYPSPLGIMKIIGNDSCISEIQFVDRGGESNPNELLERAVIQMEEYFAGKRKKFDLPVKQDGTAFQQSVWEILQAIPYGTSITYGEIAKRLGDKNLVRAVGSANGQNKIPIIIPCHRVIGHDGKLVGFAYGIERKRYLLNHERNNATITAQLSLYV